VSDIAVKIENLSKQYRLGVVGTQTLRGDFQRLWWNITGKGDPTLKIGQENKLSQKGGEYVWALQDINLEIKKGEVLGVIGKNGAGKSTLLKVLSKVTGPTTGTIKVDGRLASLLEVGTGFHPELTGKENIFLNGAILGMTKSEIKKKLDEIVEFAGVAKYLDTPVKRYSSGMYVRLAFAVAAHLDSEILVVDEVLAVGDAEFQKKAIGKMQDVSKGDGRTVLFVSHNMASIKSLCNNGILLDQGKIEYSGDVDSVIDRYNQKTEMNLGSYEIQKTENGDENKSHWINKTDSNKVAVIESISIVDDSNNLSQHFKTNQKINVEIKVNVFEKVRALKVGFDLVKKNEIVFRTQQVDNTDADTFEPGNYIFRAEIPAFMLNTGIYGIKPLISIHYVQHLTSIDMPVVFFSVEINAFDNVYHIVLNESNHPGYIFPILKWEVKEND